MVSAAPIAIFLGSAVTVALVFSVFWSPLHKLILQEFNRFAVTLDKSGVRREPEQMAITWLTVTVVVWVVIMWLLKPSILVGLLFLPVAGAIGGFAYTGMIKLKVKKRTDAFLDQFENVLRLMASGLRSGLGLRQALSLVTDEMKDPARYEFARVIGQSNIGVSIHDALDDLAGRVQTNETLMMARVIRINSQTGGDLGRVLEQLANTIRERRRMRRKISSLTAEGRLGAIILGSLPVFLGLFIVLTQETMSQGLLFTQTGHVVLMIILFLEIGGIFTLNRILKVNV
jgi:tight adherence protein B